MKKLNKRFISLLMVCACITSFTSCKNKNSDSEVSSVQDSVVETLPPQTEPADYVASSKPLTDKAKEMLAINSDTVGWIKISNTMVDYPMTQCDDDEYYLDKSFTTGEECREGTIFIDYRANFGEDASAHSDNIVIYGHNMANDTMFGSLSLYRRDLSFYEKNQIIELSSNYEDFKYKIFGFFIVSGNGDSDFPYWNCTNFDTEDDFKYYVDNVKSRSMVNIDNVDVKYGDKLVSLSTCYSDEDNTRFVVVGRRLRAGESA